MKQLPTTVDGMLELIRHEGLFVTSLSNLYQSPDFFCYVGKGDNRLMSGYVRASTALAALQNAFAECLSQMDAAKPRSKVRPVADDDLLGIELPVADDVDDLLGL